MTPRSIVPGSGPAVPKLNQLALNDALREQIGLEITYEIDGLLRAVLRLMPMDEVQSEGFAIRGLVLRGLSLNSQLMAIVGDISTDLLEAERIVFGEDAAERRVNKRSGEPQHG